MPNLKLKKKTINVNGKISKDSLNKYLNNEFFSYLQTISFNFYFFYISLIILFSKF